MSRTLTASDRKVLIRLASTMPVGAPERKAILNGLSKQPKTAARNDKRLAAALLKYLDEIRNDWQKMFDGDKNYARGGKYDPVADVGVAVGPNAKRYTNANADVVLHYDGAGYDIFSEQGDLGIEKYRRDVEKLGRKYGYHAEPLTNWSLGFYYEG